MDPRINELRALLRDDPGSRRFFQLGELLRKEGELVEGESVLRSGLEYHPRYVAAWVSLGRIEFARTRWADAEKSYARALELDPENTVAARLIGETAEELRHWDRALKAYQLASMLSGRDPELDAKIIRIERRIGGDESYDAPTEPDLAAPPLFDPVEVVEDELDVLEEFQEVFVEPEEEPFRPQPPREVFSFSDDDPFAVRATGDTGVWVVGDDVFSSPAPDPEPEPEPEIETVFEQEDVVFEKAVEIEEPIEAAGAEPDMWSDVEAPDGVGTEPIEAVEMEGAVEAAEAEPETWSGVETPDGIGPAFIPEDNVAAAPEIPEVAVEPEPDTEPLPTAEIKDSWDASEDIPLPTLTLARLAVAQDDVDLARRTLRSLLHRSPDDVDAQRMLEELDGEHEVISMESRVEVDAQRNMAAAKSTALRGWMDAIKLAAERRTP